MVAYKIIKRVRILENLDQHAPLGRGAYYIGF
jgi:hypothetical protein